MKSFNWKGRRRRPGLVILTIVLVAVLFAAFAHEAPDEVPKQGSSCYGWMEEQCKGDGECMEGLFEVCVQSES